jgi:hypothetical protein
MDPEHILTKLAARTQPTYKRAFLSRLFGAARGAARGATAIPQAGRNLIREQERAIRMGRLVDASRPGNAIADEAGRFLGRGLRHVSPRAEEFLMSRLGASRLAAAAAGLGLGTAGLGYLGILGNKAPAQVSPEQLQSTLPPILG